MQLGEILLKRGQIRKHQLDFMVELQKVYRKTSPSVPLGILMLRHRLITPVALEQALATQQEMPEEGITTIVNKLAEEMSRLTKLLPSNQN